MDSKLTISVDDVVISRAKRYAEQTGRSLSELIEQYLRQLTNQNSREVLSQKLESIVGAVTLPKNFNEETELRNYLENRYL